MNSNYRETSNANYIHFVSMLSNTKIENIVRIDNFVTIQRVFTGTGQCLIGYYWLSSGLEQRFFLITENV